ncbi:MAG: hypothetical protein IT313_05410 [Anaerolineales bacterium]|nr:hypothetical protein [Anaerolineales bacterium]
MNEDNWFFLQRHGVSESLCFAVIDGAGVRKLLPEIDTKIRDKFPRFTPPAFASYILKILLEEKIKNEPTCPLKDALIQANDGLRTEITKIFGTFNAQYIVDKLGQPFSSDPRNVRLVLPTCVITLARLDLVSSRLEFAHLGDTSLFEACQDGTVIRHTRDQMGEFDNQALESVRAMQTYHQIKHFIDAVSSPEGREFIIQSGIRLNYVDENGTTNPQHGCGVLNGLPEMEDYIETGVVEIDPSRTFGFFALSDGLELLSPLDEKLAEQQQRYQKMGRIVRRFGLRGLYNQMTQMVSSDIHLDIYPRTKLQDDATGIYVQLGTEHGGTRQ